MFCRGLVEEVRVGLFMTLDMVMSIEGMARVVMGRIMTIRGKEGRRVIVVLRLEMIAIVQETGKEKEKEKVEMIEEETEGGMGEGRVEVVL